VREIVQPADIDAAAGHGGNVGVPLLLHAAQRLGGAGDVVVEPEREVAAPEVGEGLDDLEGAVGVKVI
jgi:hypothetical protein